MTTAENQVATAVYSETDKSFPSSAVPAGSSPEDQFKTIASKITIDPESTEQSDGLDSEDEVSFSLKMLFQETPLPTITINLQVDCMCDRIVVIRLIQTPVSL